MPHLNVCIVILFLGQPRPPPPREKKEGTVKAPVWVWVWVVLIHCPFILPRTYIYTRACTHTVSPCESIQSVQCVDFSLRRLHCALPFKLRDDNRAVVVGLLIQSNSNQMTSYTRARARRYVDGDWSLNGVYLDVRTCTRLKLSRTLLLVPSSVVLKTLEDTATRT